jgi:hypothetical protein
MAFEHELLLFKPFSGLPLPPFPLRGSPKSLVISDAYHQSKINISGILFEMKE